MPFLFTRCDDAVKHATDTHTFGLHYSETQTQDLSLHLHDCCEILLCLSSGNTCLIDGKSYDVYDGDVFVINQFEAHKITADAKGVFAHFALQIHPDYLKKHSTNFSDLSHCFYTRDEGISHKIALADAEIAEMEQLFMLFRKNTGFGDDVLKNAAVDRILVLVNQAFLRQENFMPTSSAYNKTIARTIAYIHTHLAEEMTLEVLAKHAFVSVNQLCKLFKTTFETSVAKYIIAKRIAEAKKLLAQGKSVSETALACGFTDYANFIRVFKKIVGVSPGKYHKI